VSTFHVQADFFTFERYSEYHDNHVDGLLEVLKAVLPFWFQEVQIAEGEE
jgi:hypothetical protein